MKIMQVAGGGDRGGAKPHIISLCSRLMLSHQLELVSLRSGEFADDAEAAGIQTKTIYSGFAPADYIRLILHARREKPDIVHCHGAKANLAGVFLKLFCGCTIITTIHSDWRLDYMHNFFKRVTIGKMNSLALKLFDYYVTVSDRFQNLLISRGFSPLKMMAIYNGLDFSQRCPPFDRASYLRKAGLDYHDGDVVLGILARLDPVKDIPTLLRAFAQAQASVPNLKLIIGGDGEDMGKLRILSKELGLNGSVSFLGWVNHVPQFFAACDIDVLCSISESFPYSVLEGIREGCAVITSDVGGMRQLIDNGENGYIFAPKDVKAFAGFIIELANHPEKRRLFAERLYKKASSLYSLDSMAQTQSQIYERILRLKERASRRDGVLICGAYGRNNSGDEAILKAILRSLRETDPELPLTVMTRKPMETALDHRVHAIYTFSYFRFYRAMRKCRLFISGGGNLIQDVTSSRSLYFYLYTIFLAKKLGCRVLMYGCGIGHIHRPLNRKLAKVLLSKYADIITLRDCISQKELKNMGVAGPEIRLSADPALSLCPAPGTEADEYLRARGISPEGRYICFALRSWRSFQEYDLFARAAEHAYIRYGLTALFVPFEMPRDLSATLLCAKAMTTPYYIVDPPQNVELTISLLRKAKMVCAMRLHALVFAASAGVPFVAASYDIKVNGFMQYVGNNACCDLSHLTASWLCDQIDRIVAQAPAFTSSACRLRELERENIRAAAELL